MFSHFIYTTRSSTLTKWLDLVFAKSAYLKDFLAINPLYQRVTLLAGVFKIWMYLFHHFNLNKGVKLFLCSKSKTLKHITFDTQGASQYYLGTKGFRYRQRLKQTERRVSLSISHFNIIPISIGWNRCCHSFFYCLRENKES